MFSDHSKHEIIEVDDIGEADLPSGSGSGNVAGVMAMENNHNDDNGANNNTKIAGVPQQLATKFSGVPQELAPEPNANAADGKSIEVHGDAAK